MLTHFQFLLRLTSIYVLSLFTHSFCSFQTSAFGLLMGRMIFIHTYCSTALIAQFCLYLSGKRKVFPNSKAKLLTFAYLPLPQRVSTSKKKGNRPHFTTIIKFKILYDILTFANSTASVLTAVSCDNSSLSFSRVNY